MMSLQTRGTAMLFLIFFSCHVINGPDYSNEHMNLKTTSQKWCIYISNEINRRERSSLQKLSKLDGVLRRGPEQYMKISRKSNNIIFALQNSSRPFVRDANSTASRVWLNTITTSTKMINVRVYVRYIVIYPFCMSRRMSLHSVCSIPILSLDTNSHHIEIIDTFN